MNFYGVMKNLRWKSNGKVQKKTSIEQILIENLSYISDIQKWAI